MNNDQTETQADDDIDMDQLKGAIAHGAVVMLVGFGLWIGGMVVAGKINDVIFGRE